MGDIDNTNEFRDGLQVVGNDLMDRAREMVREGNARTFIVRNRDGEQLLASNLTIAAGIGGAAVLFYLPIAIIVVIAAVLLRLQIEILHEVDETEDAREAPTILIDQSREAPAAKPASTPRKRRTRISDE